uniref:6-phosphogluconate dehydrogenase NADP-binding domain-containing protein n=1 Tax=Oryza glumipatula TaxID=40148 RepID=A0A0D9Y9S1_9ORYZ
MTTSNPTLATEIAEVAVAKGYAAVDAPVSGGDHGACKAALSIFAGGNVAVVTRLTPLFKLMGNAMYMG